MHLAMSVYLPVAVVVVLARSAVIECVTEVFSPVLQGRYKGFAGRMQTHGFAGFLQQSWVELLQTPFVTRSGRRSGRRRYASILITSSSNGECVRVSGLAAWCV